MGNTLKIQLFVMALLLFMALSSTVVRGADTVEMVLYPTDVREAGDLAYLRDSLRLMAAAKFATVASEVRLEEREETVRDASAIRVRQRLVNSQGRVVLSAEVSGPQGNDLRHFEASAKDSAGIMMALDTLVAKMKTSLFHTAPVAGAAALTSHELSTPAAGQTPHPDRAIKTNSGFGLSISQEAFAKQITIDVESNRHYKSAVLSVQSKAMTAGDIDGDSLDEILIATNTKLYIYQLREGKIRELTSISLPGGLQVHGLSVADLDHNGIMEIYLSSTRDRAPRSFILQWTAAGGVKWLYENVYWYLRTLSIKGEGTILAGQKGGVVSLMQPGVFRLHLKPGEGVVAGDPLVLPESVDLFDFVFADLNNDGLQEIVALDKKEQLKVYNSTLELLYTSPAGFGGRELEKEYTAPIRLVVADFNNDGKEDILLVDNELYSPSILKKTRLYKNGQVRGLLWDGLGFMEMWHTNIFQNGVADFQFLISNEKGSGLRGMLFVVEPEKGDLLQSFLLGSGCRLSAFAMDFLPKGTE
jgi:hypothetical protein